MINDQSTSPICFILFGVGLKRFQHLIIIRDRSEPILRSDVRFRLELTTTSANIRYDSLVFLKLQDSIRDLDDSLSLESVLIFL